MPFFKFVKTLSFLIGALLLVNALFACKQQMVSVILADGIFATYNGTSLHPKQANKIKRGDLIYLKVDEDTITPNYFVSYYLFRNKHRLLEQKPFVVEQISYQVTTDVIIELQLEKRSDYLEISFSLPRIAPYYKDGEQKISLLDFLTAEQKETIIFTPPIMTGDSITQVMRVKKEIPILFLKGPLGYLLESFTLETININSLLPEEKNYTQNSDLLSHHVNANNIGYIYLEQIQTAYLQHPFSLKISFGPSALKKYVYELDLKIAPEISADISGYIASDPTATLNLRGLNSIGADKNLITIKLNNLSKAISSYKLNDEIITFDYYARQIDLLIVKDTKITLTKDSIINEVDNFTPLKAHFILVESKLTQNKYEVQALLRQAIIVEQIVFTTKDKTNYLNPNLKYVVAGQNSDSIYSFVFDLSAPLVAIEIVNPRPMATSMFTVHKLLTSAHFTLKPEEVIYDYQLSDNTFNYQAMINTPLIDFKEETIKYWRWLKKEGKNYQIIPIKLVVDFAYQPLSFYTATDYGPYLTFTDYALGLSNEISFYSMVTILETITKQTPLDLFKANESGSYTLKENYTLLITDKTNPSVGYSYLATSPFQLKIDNLSAGNKLNIKIIYHGISNTLNQILINNNYELVTGLNIYDNEMFKQMLNQNLPLNIINPLSFKDENPFLNLNTALSLNANYTTLNISGANTVDLIVSTQALTIKNALFNLNDLKIKNLIKQQNAPLILENVLASNLNTLVKGTNIDLVVRHLQSNNIYTNFLLDNSIATTYQVHSSHFTNLTNPLFTCQGTGLINLVMYANEIALLALNDSEIKTINQGLGSKKLLTMINSDDYINYIARVAYSDITNLRLKVNVDNENYNYQLTYDGLVNLVNSLDNTFASNYLLFCPHDYDFTLAEYNTKYPLYLASINTMTTILLDFRKRFFYLCLMHKE